KREHNCLAAVSGKPFRIYETPLSSRIASKRKPQAKPCLLNIVLLPSTNGFTSISILQKKVFVSISRIFQNEKKRKNDCTRVKNKDGTFHWLEINSMNLLDEPGVEAIVWNYRDITQRKQLEQEVAEAKEQLEVILQNVAAGITVVDANDRLIYVNDVAAHRLGFPSLTALLAAQQAGKVHRHEKFTVWDELGRPLPSSERPTAKALR